MKLKRNIKKVKKYKYDKEKMRKYLEKLKAIKSIEENLKIDDINHVIKLNRKIGEQLSV